MHQELPEPTIYNAHQIHDFLAHSVLFYLYIHALINIDIKGVMFT